MSKTPVSSIRNLGPAYEKFCARAGITSAEELRALGADAAYARLLETGTRPHFIGYYVLVMGLEGRPWNDCTGKEKKALRARFDALKARSHDRDRDRLEAILNRIGVIDRSREKPSCERPVRPPRDAPVQPTSSSPEKK